MAIPIWDKLVTETFSIGLDFTGQLPDSTTLVSGVASAFDSSGASASSTVLALTGITVDEVNNIAKVKLKAGSAIGKFRILFTMTLSNGDIIVEEAFLYVR